MRLEDYFEFLDPNDIRIKGHRIGIDDVLFYYLEGYTPEEILANLPTLSAEQIYATITYYLHNRTEMEAYLSRLAIWREERYQTWAANPPPVAQRLRALKTQTIAEKQASGGMKVRFLLDENLPPRLKVALLRLNPTIDVLRVGDPGVLALGTPDPDVLQYLDLSQRLLVTFNRTSMPTHIEAHWAKGKHLWGLLWVRPKTSVGRLAQELLLVWEASEAEEWINRLDWIPF